jgi:N-glycosylase/DNA lyase
MAAPEDGTQSTLSLPRGSLHLEYTLTNGQIFRWRKAGDGWWDVVSGDRLLRIREPRVEGDLEHFTYETFPTPGDEAFLRRFLRLDVDLSTLYERWRASDEHLSRLTERFSGLRLVLQKPEECLLSFICSTANFIPRIMKAVALIARNYGEPIASPDGKTLTHAFPAAPVIAELDPEKLAIDTGLEWRAANLVKVAKQVAAMPEGWLDELATRDYATVRTELTRLDGVGPKIADCVALFSMAKDGAVPVDTHVWQLTRDRYLPQMKGKSLTAAAYAQVLQFYQTRFDKAGWAQQYLFYDHLLESRARRPRRD